MSRTYTVIGPNGEREVYFGFNQRYDPIRLDYVVLVLIEGNVEVFAIDNIRKSSGLIKYLHDREPNAVIVGSYERK